MGLEPVCGLDLLEQSGPCLEAGRLAEVGLLQAISAVSSTITKMRVP